MRKTFLRFAAIFIAAAFIFSQLLINSQISDCKKRLKTAQLYLQGLEEIKNLKYFVDTRENLINLIRRGKVPAEGLLKLISAIVPSSIILDEFSLDQSTHIMRLRGIVVLGGDSAAQALADFINALGNSKFIHEANLISSGEAQGKNTFEIECILAQ